MEELREGSSSSTLPFEKNFELIGLEKNLTAKLKEKKIIRKKRLITKHTQSIANKKKSIMLKNIYVHYMHNIRNHAAEM
jgi:hypothetical protein